MALFDDLKQIQNKKQKDYWEKLSEKDKKGFNTYMLNRFFSMNSDYIDVINYIQKYNLNLEREVSYKLFMDLIPKNSIFLKYLKPKKEKEYNKKLINYFCDCFEINEFEAGEYIDIMKLTDDGKTEIKEILEMYACDEKEIKKIMEEL